MNRARAAAAMSLAFVVAAILAAVTLAVAGAGVKGTNTALGITGRFSFLLFWPAYAGAAAVVVGGERFRALQRNGREFGLAFASAHLVHLALVGWLCWIGHAPDRTTFVFFGVAAIFTYALAALSVGRLRRAVGSPFWRLIRFVGMNTIALAFAADFLTRPLNGNLRHVVAYLPFTVLVVGGFMLRFIAWTFGRQLSRMREA